MSCPVDPGSAPERGGLLVLAPLRVEARAVGAGRARVVRTGSGPRRSSLTAERLVSSHGAAAVAVMGLAGAVARGLSPGTVVVADRVLDCSWAPVGEPLGSAPLLAAALRSRGLPVEVGPVVTSDRLVRGQQARAALARTGAIAVDMETASLLEVPWGVPVAVVRVIVDTPERELRSSATVREGWRALATLRSAMPAVEAWAGAAGPRTVLLAGPRSFCAGVERAIETVQKTIERYGPPVYVRRQIVHNRHVVEDLEARGAIFVHDLDEVPDGATVVFSAHGVAPSVRAVADDRRMTVVDATCPLVAKVHREVNRFRASGFQVVLIGHAGHDEIEGTLGEDDSVVLVEDIGDVALLDVRDPERLAYVTQTTLSPDDVSPVVAALRERFPGVSGPHAADICYATHNRQEAVRAIAADCDLVLVIGSANSSNTARLVEVAGREGCRAEMIEDETAIDVEWLAGTRTIGLTAGASAPPALVTRVLSAIGGLGILDVRERAVREEKVTFPLPVEIR